MTFYHLSNRYLSNIMKILAKINTMQNRTYQHFTFCSFTVLNKLKALQLSRACLSTITSSINTAKIWHHGQKPLEPKHMKNANCMQKFVHKKRLLSTTCTDTCLETLSPLVNCSVDNVLSEVGPYCNSAFLQFVNSSHCSGRRVAPSLLTYLTPYVVDRT